MTSNWGVEQGPFRSVTGPVHLAARAPGVLDIDFGKLAVLLIAAVVALFAAAYVIGVVLRWLAEWKQGRSRLRARRLPVREVLNRERR